MNLIIQSSVDIATPDLKYLAKLTGASRIDAMAVPAAPPAFCLRQAVPHAELAEFCAAAQLDFTFVAADLRLQDFGLVVMDMDSTVITIECIDEIADMLGIKPQVAAITEAAMRGELDFRQSLSQRVALLAGLGVEALQRVYDERLRLTPGVETLLRTLHAAGIHSMLVSGGFTFFTDRLQPRLQLGQAHSNTLEVVDGKLTGRILGDILDAQAKADWLIKVRDQLGLAPTQTIAIGDGANDLKMMAAAGLSVAYHAKPVVRAQAQVALNFVGLDGLLNVLQVPMGE